jgi:hypothetical protein
MNKWSRKNFNKEYVLSQESGEAALREFLEHYDVGTEKAPENPTPEELENHKAAVDSFNRMAEMTVEFYRLGVFENKVLPDKGFCLIQYLSNTTTLTYREFIGKDKLNVLKDKRGVLSAEELYRIAGALSGVGSDTIAGLRGVDLRAAEVAGGLFFLVSR